MRQALLQLVVDDLGLILRPDAGEILLLRLRDTELVPRVLDVSGQVVPRVRLLLGRLDVVVDVVEVDPGEVSSPRGHRPCEEVVERLVAHRPHPVGLVLVLRDRLNDLVRNPPARLKEVVAGLIRAREPELDRVVGADLLNDLHFCLCCQNAHFPSTPNSTRPAQRASRTVEPTFVPYRKERALRVELCLPQSLISRALGGASMPLGLGRRPDTQGQSNHATRFQDDPAKT